MANEAVRKTRGGASSSRVPARRDIEVPVVSGGRLINRAKIIAMYVLMVAEQWNGQRQSVERQPNTITKLCISNALSLPV